MVPAAAADGLNVTINLLIAIDMFGFITAARVLEDFGSNDNYSVVDVI